MRAVLVLLWQLCRAWHVLIFYWSVPNGCRFKTEYLGTFEL